MHVKYNISCYVLAGTKSNIKRVFNGGFDVQIKQLANAFLKNTLEKTPNTPESLGWIQ